MKAWILLFLAMGFTGCGKQPSPMTPTLAIQSTGSMDMGAIRALWSSSEMGVSYDMTQIQDASAFPAQIETSSAKCQMQAVAAISGSSVEFQLNNVSTATNLAPSNDGNVNICNSQCHGNPQFYVLGVSCQAACANAAEAEGLARAAALSACDRFLGGYILTPQGNELQVCPANGACFYLQSE